jgi:two-component system sensor histidine kinase CssS
VKNFRLSVQLNLLFTVVILFTSLVFIFIFENVFYSQRESNVNMVLNSYIEVVQSGNNSANLPTLDNIGYIILENDEIVVANNTDILASYFDLNSYFKQVKKSSEVSDFIVTLAHRKFYFSTVSKEDTKYVVFTDDSRVSVIENNIPILIQLSFVILIVLGNIIIIFWSNITVSRIKSLNENLLKMKNSKYRKKIEVVGHDEISDLAMTIEEMRIEIQSNDKQKEEMLQNLSHDFKTPISVIKGYAEAIIDGIIPPKDAKIIIEQSEILYFKVKQLIEYTKLEYFQDPSTYVNVRLDKILNSILESNKFRRNIEFILDLDESEYFGVAENFHVVFNNIVDNALRYAKSKIIIILKNKKLSFFNDGNLIPPNVLEHMFTPYMKGADGQFGLGLSIVYKTLTHFNYDIKAENVVSPIQGVSFIVTPKEENIN